MGEWTNNCSSLCLRCPKGCHRSDLFTAFTAALSAMPNGVIHLSASVLHPLSYFPNDRLPWSTNSQWKEVKVWSASLVSLFSNCLSHNFHLLYMSVFRWEAKPDAGSGAGCRRRFSFKALSALERVVVAVNSKCQRCHSHNIDEHFWLKLIEYSQLQRRKCIA